MPAWVDNGLHSHGKRERVPLAVDGLLLRAISRCSDLLTDGFIEATWVEKQLRDGVMGPKQRVQILELALEHRILERIAAGESRTVTGASRPGLRGSAVTVVVGPVEADGYVVHDYLDCNRSREETEEIRERDAAKKRGQRSKKRQEQLPWQQFENGSSGAPSSQVSPGESPLKGGDSGDRDRKEEQLGVEETKLNDARAAARSSDPKVQDVLDVLRAAPRLYLDAVAVENAIVAFPTGDPLKAAREAVTLGRDPAYRSTNGARLLWKTLEQQTAGGPGRPGAARPDQHTAADFQALKGAA